MFIGFVMLRGILIRNFAFVGALAAGALMALILWGMGNWLVRSSRGWLLNHRGTIRRQQLPLLAGLLLAVAALVLVPVPGRRVFTVALEPIRVAALVAPEELRLREANWTAGQVVAPGEMLASLDPDLAVAERGEAQAAAGEMRISGATARHSGDAGQAVSAQAGEVAARQRSQLLARRVERAELRAPFAGRVLTASMPGVMDERYEAGDTVCVIGDFTRVRATASLLESDLEDVRVGAPVRIRLRIRPGEVLAGRVSDIEPPAEEVRGLRAYRVRIALEGRPRDARAGLTGRAWIATPARPVAAHVLHFLAHFIRLDLWV
jgi:multidrug resistance efflux pump